MIVNKGPFLEFMGIKLTESAINTYTEKEAATPTSENENLVMLIHQIEMHVDHADTPAAAGTTDTTAQIVDRSMSSLKNHADQELIALCQHSFRGALRETAAGVFTIVVDCSLGERQRIVYYDPPLVYAKSKIYLGVKGSGNTVVKVASAKIGYTVERVSAEAFIKALVQTA